MRTTPEECAELGRILAGKVNTYRAPVTVLIPRRAISVISAPGQAFHDPDADMALFNSITRHLRSDIPVHEFDAAINDPVFARACADCLLENMETANHPNSSPL